MKDDHQRVWPKEAAPILSALLKCEITERTLSNWRYARRGPAPEYLNGRPSYTLGELRRFAREAFLPQPPIRYRLPQPRRNFKPSSVASGRARPTRASFHGREG